MPQQGNNDRPVDMQRSCTIPSSDYGSSCDRGRSPLPPATPPCQPNKLRRIEIVEINNGSGFIVNVGCHQFAIETKARLITLLAQYIAEPQKTEDKFYAGQLF